MKFLIILSVLLVNTLANIDVSQKNALKLSIFLSSRCPYAASFIEQLAEAYKQYKPYLVLDFIPFGKTTRLANGKLWCMYGEKECEFNRVQRCVLRHLVNNQDAQMAFMVCEYSGTLPNLSKKSTDCLNQVGMKPTDIEICISKNRPDPLFADAELRTQRALKVLPKIPAVVVNDNIDISINDRGRRNLLSMICFSLANISGTGVDVKGCTIMRASDVWYHGC